MGPLFAQVPGGECAALFESLTRHRGRPRVGHRLTGCSTVAVKRGSAALPHLTFYGRQEDEEDHPWGDLQGWQPWHEADGQAPKDEEDGVGNPEGSGQLRQQGRGAKQEDERLYGVHLNTAPLCTVSVPSVGANLFPKGWRHELQAILVLQSYLKVHLDGRSQLAREKVRHRL